MALLELENVSKTFGGVQANENISFQMDSEIVGLIGPNGAGKTTLFNCISGYHPVTSGKIRFDGEDISDYSAHDVAQTGIGRTFQITRGMYGLNIEENVMIGSFIDTRSQSKAKEKSRSIIRDVGLEVPFDMDSQSLSVSQQKRLALARTLAIDPELLMLDELLAGLNADEISGMLSTIERIHDERDLAILMTEHVLEAIMSVSDRIIVLDQGQKIADGYPEDVVDDEQVKKAYIGGESDVEG